MKDVQAVAALKEAYQKLTSEIGKVVIGQEDTVRLLLTAIFCQGHCLLVGVPGLAKTLLIHTISEALDLEFNRIQFTPDLMPSDILGSETLDNERQLKFVKGPIFANIILADEINRTPPKTQAALLEAMQEKQVTIGDETMKLPTPFLVLATQNPIDQEGTYLLPEAQTDRFMLKCKIDYPEFEEERQVMRMVSTSDIPLIKPVISLEQIVDAKKTINQIYLDEKIEKYILDLVFATRFPEKYRLESINLLFNMAHLLEEVLI